MKNLKFMNKSRIGVPEKVVPIFDMFSIIDKGSVYVI